MIRKMLMASIAILALLFTLLSPGATPNADAQYGACDYHRSLFVTNYYGYEVTCNKALPYPGPFTEMPAPPVGPYGWGKLNIVAAAAPAPAPAEGEGTGGGDAAAPLAHTGSESTVLGYVGTGLIAFGAVALGTRRKFFQGTLD